jgi:hypothetical protein
MGGEWLLDEREARNGLMDTARTTELLLENRRERRRRGLMERMRGSNN